MFGVEALVRSKEGNPVIGRIVDFHQDFSDGAAKRSLSEFNESLMNELSMWGGHVF